MSIVKDLFVNVAMAPSKINKKKFYKRTFIDKIFGKVSIVIRTYYCKECKKWFNTNLKSIIESYAKVN
ncbi:MAG: hypothetical protein LBT66_01825 [Methanobrevibacter sp.]|jgi:hypothetical protein|nr:hypothetical protein [Candidatus Methanovirga meridionalis]